MYILYQHLVYVVLSLVLFVQNSSKILEISGLSQLSFYVNKPPIDGGCLLKNNGTENPRYGLTKL